MKKHNLICGTVIAMLLMLQSLAASPDREDQLLGPAPPGDPFVLRGAESGESGFVSAAPASMPRGIRVVGILKPRQGDPVGVLDIPGAGALHFVRKGDVVQFEPKDETRPVARPEVSAPQASGHIYLLIVSISESQIEIAPKARPQETRIYR